MVRRLLVDALDVGNIRLRDEVATLIDRSTVGPYLPDGLLPLHIFKQVTLDVREGYLMVRK